MSWLRRTLGGPDPAPDEHGPDTAGDTPEALRDALAGVIRLVNRNAGQLPGVAVVRARRLTDTLLEIIDTSAVRPLDVYAVITVRSTLGDYLPTTVQGYLAVPEEMRDIVRGTGLSPTTSLLEQLDALQTSALSVLAAAQNQDADALMTQGAFLRTKFSGSDLDL